MWNIFKLPSNLRLSSQEIDLDASSPTPTNSLPTNNSPLPPTRQRTSSTSSSSSSSPLKSQTPLVSGSDSSVMLLEDAQEASYEDWNRILTGYQQPSAEKEPLRVEMGQLIGGGGVPDHYRGKVWTILSKADESVELQDLYPSLLKRETSSEVMDMISIDIMRTFPAHALFKDPSGIGQDILLKISKAYSNYDEEVGYFQGLSFLAAALVLHLPEEEAFCLLVKMTFEYGLRGLYRNGMETLKTRFYQFERYIEELMPELHAHLTAEQIEIQMFASQWFLTVFCAKFSLSFAFRVLDLFFLEGMDAVLKVALCILKDNRKELLGLSFEEILHHLRIQIPKKYSNPPSISSILTAAAEMKLNPSKLVQFEAEHKARLVAEAAAEAEAKLASSASSPSVEASPLDLLTSQLSMADKQRRRLERENKRLAEHNMRLEEETNSLARQLVERQVSLMQALEKAGEEKATLRKELVAVKESGSRERGRLQQELDQLRTLYRAALAEALEEKSRLEQEKCELKTLCRQLGQQHELSCSNLTAENNELKSIVAFLSTNHRALQSLVVIEDSKKGTPMTPTISPPEVVPIDSLLEPHLFDSTSSASLEICSSSSTTSRQSLELDSSTETNQHQPIFETDLGSELELEQSQHSSSLPSASSPLILPIPVVINTEETAEQNIEQSVQLPSSPSSTPTVPDYSHTHLHHPHTHHQKITPEFLARIKELIDDVGERGTELSKKKKEEDMVTRKRLSELEEQLAIVKLQLAESECQKQQLEMTVKQLNRAGGGGGGGGGNTTGGGRPATSRPIGIASAPSGPLVKSASASVGASPTSSGWLMLRRNGK